VAFEKNRFAEFRKSVFLCLYDPDSRKVAGEYCRGGIFCVNLKNFIFVGKKLIVEYITQRSFRTRIFYYAFEQKSMVLAVV
jgi:hypothetical protein